MAWNGFSDGPGLVSMLNTDLHTTVCHVHPNADEDIMCVSRSVTVLCRDVKSLVSHCPDVISSAGPEAGLDKEVLLVLSGVSILHSYNSM